MGGLEPSIELVAADAVRILAIEVPAPGICLDVSLEPYEFLVVPDHVLPEPALPNLRPSLTGQADEGARGRALERVYDPGKPGPRSVRNIVDADQSVHMVRHDDEGCEVHARESALEGVPRPQDEQARR